MPARTRQVRQRSIRELLSLIVVIPSFCLLALWAVIAAGSVVSALREQNFVTAEGIYGGTGQTLYSALAAERLQACVWLSGGRTAALAPLQARYAATDRAAAAFLAAARARKSAIPAAATPALVTFETALASRATVRAGTSSGQLTAAAAGAAYNAIIADEYDLDAGLVVTADGSLYRQAAATVQAGRAVELASQELVLLDGAMAAGGTMSAADSAQFAEAAAGRGLLLGAALGQLQPSLSAPYQQAGNSATGQSFAATEDQIAASPGQIAVSSATLATAGQAVAGYQDAAQQAQGGLAALAATARSQHVLVAAAVVVLGLAAVIFSMALMIRFGLLVTSGLTRLRDETLDDPHASSQPSPVLEIATVGAALSAARSKATLAEAGLTELRDTSRQAVLNLAERSQALLASQQALLDTTQLPAGQSAPAAESSAVDHLTTRMRRHSDSLLVLTGGSPDRSWTGPVPMQELLTVVADSVADIAPVTVAVDSTDEVAPAVAPDVIQLIVELAASGAQYAPHEGDITIRAGRVGRGVAVEIEDRGAEFTPAELEHVNSVLASPPEFELGGSDRVGFVIAARLAAKHRITATLRTSPLGGTSTILVLPHALLVAAGDRDTIIDGSLPRIAAGAQPTVPTAPDYAQPAAVAEAAQPDSRVAPYVAPDEKPAEAKPAPWYWLTASAPAPPPPEPDLPLSPAGSAAAAPPLPRRIRPASPGPLFRRQWREDADAESRDDS